MPYELITTGTSLFFLAGNELWTTNGARGGTKSLGTFGDYSSPFVDGERLYLFVHTQSGIDLYRGGVAGMQRLATIAPADGFKFPVSAAARGESIVFSGFNAVNGVEPWITEGTKNGTRMLKNVRDDTSLSSEPFSLAARDGNLMFMAFDGDTTALFETDGSAIGTVRVSGDAGLDGATSAGHVVFFRKSLAQPMLWRSDGTAAGTFSVGITIDPPIVPFHGGAVVSDLNPVLWFSDGPSGETRPIVDSSVRAAALRTTARPFVWRDCLLLGSGTELWAWDGVAPGPAKLFDLGSSSAIANMADVGGTLYIATGRTTGGFDLYRSDGTAEGTRKITRVNAESPDRMWNVGGRLVFQSLRQLWTSDGTEEGTVAVSEAVSNPYCMHDQDFAVAAGVLYWLQFVNGEVAQIELWRSDGTAGGTFALTRYPKAAEFAYCAPHPIAAIDGRVYFTGSDAQHGAEPWVTDGTVAGTHLLFDINPGSASSGASRFTHAGATLYFTADDGFHGTELWALPVGAMPRHRAAALNQRPRNAEDISHRFSG